MGDQARRFPVGLTVAVAISLAALLASEWLVRRQRGEERD